MTFKIRKCYLRNLFTVYTFLVFKGKNKNLLYFLGLLNKLAIFLIYFSMKFVSCHSCQNNFKTHFQLKHDRYLTGSMTAAAGFEIFGNCNEKIIQPVKQMSRVHTRSWMLLIQILEDLSKNGNYIWQRLCQLLHPFFVIGGGVGVKAVPSKGCHFQKGKKNHLLFE